MKPNIPEGFEVIEDDGGYYLRDKSGKIVKNPDGSPKFFSLQPSPPPSPPEPQVRRQSEPQSTSKSRFPSQMDPKVLRLNPMEVFAGKAVGIPEEGLNWAYSVADKAGRHDSYGGKGDAARHMALGWLAYQSDVSPLAYAGIQAKEYLGMEPGPYRRQDLHNNELGYKLGALTDDAAEAEQMILEAIKRKSGISMQTAEEGGYGAVPKDNPFFFLEDEDYYKNK